MIEEVFPVKNLYALLRFITLSTLFCLSIGPTVAATNYSFVELTDKPDASRSGHKIVDLSATGVAVGQAWAMDFDNHAMIWINPKNPTDLTPNFAFSDSSATAINSNEEVVVQKNNGTSILWINGVEIDIINPTGGSVYAKGINDFTQVVGAANGHAFLWENGMMTDLGTLPGGGSSSAADINNLGQVVGSADDANGVKHAVMWDAAGVIIDLGILPGDDGSEAVSINDAGVVVGRSFTTRISSFTGSTLIDVMRAFIWSNDVLTELAGAGSFARDINNNGQAVGVVPINNVSHAVVWDSNLLMADLNPFLNNPNSCSGVAINDSGQVLGSCSDSGGVPFSFILTPSDTAPPPAPEPTPEPIPTDAEADVAVEMSAGASRVKRGDELDYTIVVTNNGPDTAESVVLTDALPSNVVLVSVSGTGCTGTSIITCQLGDLYSAASETVLITVSPFKGRRVTNKVSVTSNTDDPDSDNNMDKVRTRVKR